MTSSLALSKYCGGSGPLARASVLNTKQGAPIPLEPASQLPDEMWLLVLAFGGLRTSATAASCSSTLRSYHHTVASTPALLARALLVDHGLTGAAVSLYGSPAGHPHDRHAVRNDADVAATLRELVLLSAPPGPASSAAATAMASCTSIAETAVAAIAALEATASDGSTNGYADAKSSRPRIPAVTSRFFTTPISWGSGGASAFRQLVGGVLCAAAAAGHVRMVAMTLALGATELDRALLSASAMGRSRIVRLLLASGADPDAAEPFGSCALYEAAKNGHSHVVEILLDAGAKMEGAVVAPTTSSPSDGGLSSALGPFSTGLPCASAPSYDPGRPWAAISGSANINRLQDGGFKEAQPMRLRVPVPLAVSAGSVNAPSAVPAATAAVPARTFDIQGFFNDGGGIGDGCGTAVPTTSVRQLDEQPNTPTAAAAASKSLWEDSNDDDSGALLGDSESSFPCTPVAAAATSDNRISLPILPPLPRLPPPLPRRKQPLPLPPNRASLPLMPSLISPPPLPPALMMLLVGDRGSQIRRSGPSPLLAACKGGHVATTVLLLRRGAKVDVEGGAELLAAAQPQIVDELLAAVPGLSAHLGPALLAAAAANRANVVAALLRHGADSTFRGGMALQEAAFRSHLEVMEVLLTAGRACLQKCGAVAAALNWARCFGRVEVLRLLVESPVEV
ncbi:hypothetical protein Vafri_11998 [Volvox africanus]|uniref:Ankyrin repeat protein n=1 Tax=Volvox africanus TaxID=51714 RepID=A0A8J4BA43_9CHLO|nr:hypothetical protein Vafri_11998 [Volvox africanus]